MKERFVDSSIKFINKYEECDDLKIKRLKYGLEGIYGTIIKLIVVIVIAAIFQSLKETCLILVFYALIRTFSYGLHSKSSAACWITTILIYNVIPVLTKNFIIPDYIGYIVLGVSLLSVLLWAPADTPKKPLIRKKHRTKCKVLAVIIVLMYSIIYCFSQNISINNTLIYALFVECILINPVTYRLTKTQFKNYKYYKKKELTTV